MVHFERFIRVGEVLITCIGLRLSTIIRKWTSPSQRRSLTSYGDFTQEKIQTRRMILMNLWSSGLRGRGRRKLCLFQVLCNPSGGLSQVNGKNKRCSRLAQFLYILSTDTEKIMKIVRAIRQGRIVPNKPKTKSSKFEPYAIWTEEPSALQPPPLPAPKPPLPTNAESYNPPEEYLPTEEERKAWEAQDPEDRERNYLPQKYGSLRLVPAYDRFIKERFNRQLDLYLAPRVQRVKLNIDPESLIPKLPSPNSLKPFPNYRCLQFCHTNSCARCISVSPDGSWVISGDENGVVSLWEIIVGREIKRWKFDGKIGALAWCPRTDVSYFAIGV